MRGAGRPQDLPPDHDLIGKPSHYARLAVVNALTGRHSGCPLFLNTLVQAPKAATSPGARWQDR